MGMTCSSGAQKRTGLSPKAKVSSPDEKPVEKPKVGFNFSLTQGDAPKSSTTRNKAVEGTPLSDKEGERLLNRMPDIKSEQSDVKSFAIRERSLPPPRTGETITEDFPPKSNLKAIEVNASEEQLKVLRTYPVGDVNVAPKITITFSEPMVEVTSHAETVADDVPVRMSPEISGTWRWAGTRTLIFEAKPRLPMATEFKLTVPAGTKSASGKALEETKEWSFKTPPVTLTSHSPSSYQSVGLTPLIRLHFDQDIDPDELRRLTILKSNKGKELELRPATAKELKEGKVRPLKEEEVKRTVYLKPKKSLKPDTHYNLTVAKGLSSLEGPRKTTAQQGFNFSTYPPFEFRDSYCGNCTRNAHFTFRFNNQIDAKAFEKSMVQITPSVENLRVHASWHSIGVRGKFQAGTTYKVQISKNLQDKHGQSLDKEVVAKFHIKHSPPALWLEGQHFQVLDPVGPKEFTVSTVNVKAFEARVYKVTPEDYDNRPRANKVHEPVFPGQLVYKKIIKPEGKLDDEVRTSISFESALNKEGFGNAIIFVRQTDPPVKQPTWGSRVTGQHISWYQITQMAVDATNDGEKLHVWVSDLNDGRPIPQAKVIATLDGKTAVTNENGYATIPLKSKVRRRNENRYPRNRGANTGLRVEKGKDSCFQPYAINYRKMPQGSRTLWSVQADRGLYRPKEEVAIKGWVRRVDMGLNGGIKGPPQAGSEVSYVLKDARGNKVRKGQTQLTKLGGFGFSFKLPPNMNLGHATLSVSNKSQSTQLRIRVEEFRRPEFEVNARSSDGPHLIGSKATLSVAAKYYAGGPLAGAESQWVINARKGYYSPPNHPGFTFGSWSPWWRSRDNTTSVNINARKEISGETDGSGKHHIDLQFESVYPPRPVRISAQATVSDVNRRRMSAKTSLIVHPSEIYVGMKTETYFVKKDEPFEVDLIATNIEGEALSDVVIEVTAHRIKHQWNKGLWESEEVEEQRCTATSQKEPVQCTFKTPKGGRYILRAQVRDDKGQLNQSSMSRWVSGATTSPPSKRVERETVQLIPSKKSMSPGDTAEVLVQSPFYPAQGTLRIQRGAIERIEYFSMTDATHVLQIPIKKEHIPGFAIQVELRGSTDRLNAKGEADSTLPPRPAFAGANLRFAVPPDIHKLEVSATPEKEKVSPGSKTKIKVQLKDSTGKAVANAEVALFVVDESVLALTGHSFRNPLSSFFPGRRHTFNDSYFRGQVWLPDPTLLTAELKEENFEFEESMGDVDSAMSAEMGAIPPPTAAPKSAMKRKVSGGRGLGSRGSGPGGGGAAAAEPMIAVRSDFNPLAAFVPDLKTNSKGEVTANIKLPDNLTRYRVVVLSVSGKDRFGKGESKITARLPLMVRPSAPRFLNFGDHFEFPVVLQNQTDEAKTVSVAIRGTNIRFKGATGRKVQVPANDRVEVRFPAEAAEPGTARFQIAASSGKWADGTELSLPVWTPATTEAFATYGVIDEGAIKQPVKMPGDVITDFGGLEINTSSTQLQALTDAVIYLATYRFYCSEQMASRILSIAALRDVLSAFKARGLPSKERLIDSVARDMSRLKKMQNPDGGFGFWRPDGESWPFLSIHVAHALTRAKSKGFKVPSSTLSPLMGYLRKIPGNIPTYYSKPVQRVIEAYALYVRAHAKDVDLKAARRLVRQGGGIDSLPLEAVGWLYPVFVKSDGAMKERKAIRARLNNLVAETAATAHFTTSYTDGAHLILHSSRRLDGILLEGLILDQPKSDLIPKIVRGLLAHRTRGRWGNTQENAWVLLGLDRYFNTYEKITPNFVARAWLGDQFVGDHTFKGRTTERHQINVPMRYVAEAEKADLVLQKDGKGRMYYRIGMNYAPSDLKPPAADHGFAVERIYEGMDDPSDVRQAEDGTWHITAGARVKVTVTMVATERRYHVALVDPLPAGLEPVTPGLRGNQDTPPNVSSNQRPNRYRRASRHYRWRPSWWGPWYRHQNVRDERVEAFTTHLPAGVYTYSYSTLATTPGTFVVPPAKAEEMYFPETFGRSSGDRVVVK